MVDRAQQAFTDLGNRSKRTPKPANIQGTHYFNERFEVATLDYFGTELNDKGFMRYNAFRDEVEMASTTSQNESDLILMKSNDIEQLNIPDGQLIYTKNKIRAPLSKKHLLASLSTYFKNDQRIVSELSKYIMDTRLEKEKENIKRKIKK